jgi:hypothetical protein
MGQDKIKPADLNSGVAQMSLVLTSTGLKLENDSSNPGNLRYYGTDTGGIKGYHINYFAGKTITGTPNEVTVVNGDGLGGNPTVSIPSFLDLSSKTGVSVPTSATPVLDSNGKIAVDTTVTDFSHGIFKYYGGEELGVVALPIAQFTSPTDGYVVKYNAAADEFQLAQDNSGGAGTGSSISETITQSSHGFTTGNVLRFASDGFWTKAIADTSATAESLGIVQSVPTSDTFSIVYAGRISNLTGLSTGVGYYLSASISGGLTSIEPTGAYISKPVLWATSTTGGIVVNQRGLAGSASSQSNGSLGITIDGGGSAITSGQKGYLSVPYNCTLQSVTMLADTTGSLTLDVWRDTYANYPPTVLDSIVGSNYPTITSGIKYTDSVLSGWSTSVTGSNVLGFNVNSCSSITRVNVTFGILK